MAKPRRAGVPPCSSPGATGSGDRPPAAACQYLVPGWLTHGVSEPLNICGSQTSWRSAEAGVS